MEEILSTVHHQPNCTITQTAFFFLNLTNIQQSEPHKTFAHALTNLCEISQAQLSQAVIKGDGLAIQIPEEEYSDGIDACKLNLHGRIILPKRNSFDRRCLKNQAISILERYFNVGCPIPR